MKTGKVEESGAGRAGWLGPCFTTLGSWDEKYL